MIDSVGIIAYTRRLWVAKLNSVEIKMKQEITATIIIESTEITIGEDGSQLTELKGSIEVMF